MAKTWEMTVKWRGLKNFATFTPETGRYLRASASYMTTQIKTRAHAGRLPDGGSVAPLSRGYVKRKAKKHRTNRRDAIFTGQMMNGLRPSLSKKGKMVLGFAGSRAFGERKWTVRTGKNAGQQKTRAFRNQDIADQWTLFTRNGQKQPRSFNSKPGHVFMDASVDDRGRLERMYDRQAVAPAFNKMELDRKANSKTVKP